MTLAALAIGLAVTMAAFSLFLFTRNNDFPVFYHPDEWSKVDQIGSSRQIRNLNHPLLMLETANLLREHWSVSLRDDRQLAITGRWASALLASVGVFGFAMAGFLRYRFVGLAIVGTGTMLCPPLLVFAHYMKEDATLAGGIGVAALGAALVLSAKRSSAQLLATIVLGIGVAATASGKYVGAAIVAPALVTLCIARVPHWWLLPSRLVLIVLVTVSTFVAINARGFDDPWTLTPSRHAENAFEEEFEHGTTQHDGLHLVTPGTYCLRIAARDWMTHIWVLAAIGVGVSAWMVIHRKNPMTRWGFAAGSFLVTFVAVLSFNAIPFARYALPITVLGYFVATCVISACIVAVSRTSRRAIALTSIVLIPIIVLQGDRCLRFNRQFADDSRERLRQWVADQIPAGSRIVADSFSALGPRGDVWRYPNQHRLRSYVQSYGHASNGGSVQRLAASGVRYVVTAEPNYQRFFAPGIQAIEGNEAELDAARRFYRTLFEQGKLVWSSKPSPPSGAYVDPELRVYDITAFKSAPPDPKERNRSWLDGFWR